MTKAQKISVPHARAIVDEEERWKCLDCGTYLSLGEDKRCWNCQSYYDDVMAGIYEEPWDIEDLNDEGA